MTIIYVGISKYVHGFQRQNIHDKMTKIQNTHIRYRYLLNLIDGNLLET